LKCIKKFRDPQKALGKLKLTPFSPKKAKKNDELDQTRKHPYKLPPLEAKMTIQEI
jgi:hypothetical protein